MKTDFIHRESDFNLPAFFWVRFGYSAQRGFSADMCDWQLATSVNEYGLTSGLMGGGFTSFDALVAYRAEISPDRKSIQKLAVKKGYVVDSGLNIKLDQNA